GGSKARGVRTGRRAGRASGGGGKRSVRASRTGAFIGGLQPVGDKTRLRGQKTSAASDQSSGRHPNEPTQGIPGLEDLNPANAPPWLRPFLYILLGASIALLVGLAAPASVRRRVLRRLRPRAESTSIVPETPPLPVRTILRRFWPFARPYRGSLLLMLLIV